MRRRAAPTSPVFGKDGAEWGRGLPGGSGGAEGVTEGLGGSSPPRAVGAFAIPHSTHCPGVGDPVGLPTAPHPRSGPRGMGVSRGSPIPPQLRPCPGLTPSCPPAPFPRHRGTPGKGQCCPHSPSFRWGGLRVGAGGPRRLPDSNQRPGEAGGSRTGAGTSSVSRSLLERWEQLRRPSACRNPAGMPLGRSSPA